MFNQGFSPTLDKVFKKLFGNPGNEELTKSFINSIIGDKYGMIKEVVIIGSQFSPTPLNSPECFIDVLCMSEDEDLYILEMQKQLFTGFVKRCEAYAAAAFIGQRIQDSLKKMQQLAPDAKCFETPDYKDLNKVRSLIIIEKQTSGPLSKEPYISHHTNRSEQTGQSIFNSISYTVVQLAKFNKPDEDIATDQDKWLKFMQYGPRTSEPLYHTIADNSNIFTAAYNIIKASSFTDAEIRDLGLREKERLENVAIAQDERDAGRAEGRAEGREEGRAEGIAAANLESAKTLLKTGELSIERISELFKIDINILKKLRDDGDA